MLEAAHGKGRFVITSLFPDKIYNPAGESIAPTASARSTNADARPRASASWPSRADSASWRIWRVRVIVETSSRSDANVD